MPTKTCKKPAGERNKMIRKERKKIKGKKKQRAEVAEQLAKVRAEALDKN